MHILQLFSESVLLIQIKKIKSTFTAMQKYLIQLLLFDYYNWIEEKVNVVLLLYAHTHTGHHGHTHENVRNKLKKLEYAMRKHYISFCK